MTKNQVRLLKYLLTYSPYKPVTISGKDIITAHSLENKGLVRYNSLTKQVLLKIVNPTEDK